MKYSILALVCLALMSGCTSEKPQFVTDPDLKRYQFKRELTDEEWKKMQWVAKTLRLLRGGHGLQSDEDIQPYLDNSHEKIVDDLLQGERFVDTILLFNLQFLGFATDTLKQNGLWSFTLFDSQPALTSALEFSKGGDYLSLFNFYPKTVIRPLSAPRLFGDQEDPNDPIHGMTDEEKREYLYNQTMEEFEQAKADALAQEEFNFGELCATYQFVDWGLSSTGFNKGFSFGNSYISNETFGLCFLVTQGTPYPFTREEFIAKMDEMGIKIKTLMEIIRELQAQPMPEKITDFEFTDLTRVNPDFKEDYFGLISAQALPNSSTNFNRKRAAYILDRFLCDDLIPIDVETPEHSNGGAHGSDPSCYACHYRLDPMAGFFKDRGFFFFDFSGAPQITFDDLATADKVSYDANWKNPEGSEREWNIGVVRSESDESKNYYGEHLSDLFAILKEMPESRQCLVRRVFEYTTSKRQNVDKGYLDEALTQFNELAEQNSSEAIKYLFKTFVLGKTFSHPDPEASKCYDYPADFDPSGSAPCEVRFILDKKCSSCHFPFGGEGGLDLTSWQEFDDGFGFVHTPNGGAQLPVKESFKRIKEALESSDPETRMPYKQHMDPVDREKLYLWAEKMMGE